MTRGEKSICFLLTFSHILNITASEHIQTLALIILIFIFKKENHDKKYTSYSSHTLSVTLRVSANTLEEEEGRWKMSR